MFVLDSGSITAKLYVVIIKIKSGEVSLTFSVLSIQSKPLEDYYKKREKLLDFQVSSASGETWKELLATLHLHSSF